MTPVKDVSRLDYLRGRPFLVVEVFLSAAHGVHTEQKGWMKENENIKRDERPTIVYRVSSRIMSQSVVIIDIMKDKLVKNRLRSVSDEVDPVEVDKEMMKHFKRKYSDMIKQSLNVMVSS